MTASSPSIEATAAVETTQEPVPSSTQPAAPSPTPDIITDSSLMRLVNADYKISKNYVPDNLQEPNIKMNHTQMVRGELVQPLEDMFVAARKENIYLKLVSGYRSYREQVSLWYTYVNRYGISYASRMDDHPGASEHQLGLAVDLGNENGACELEDCFRQYSSSKWLVENAWKYGFIQRYPEEKEDVTGIVYSPWHYRYVGKEEADKIHNSELTMEEYCQQLGQ